jgi:hypothetical protein
VPNPKPTESIVYRERVRPNLGTFIAVATLLPAVTLVSEPFDYRIGIAVGLVLVISIWAALVFLAPVIQVGNSNLVVGRAEIPRNLLGKIEEIGKDQIFSERGPNLDPAAYRVFQGTVKTAVKIALNDPKDPTPYWILSTRKPGQLAEALRAKG